ncbi:hypothetical protein EGJ48_21435, partial [Pantoea dispersa]|uniref:biofilm development regulator YmgB/AriR family protein n=1 Tax=Pantoea dispersa TaxID=59814 RepID=UPI000FA2336A
GYAICCHGRSTSPQFKLQYGLHEPLTIILYLIAELEMTTDIVKLDVLRNVLEIVVGRTPDDEGF